MADCGRDVGSFLFEKQPKAEDQAAGMIPAIFSAIVGRHRFTRVFDFVELADQADGLGGDRGRGCQRFVELATGVGHATGVRDVRSILYTPSGRRSAVHHENRRETF